MSAVLAIGQQPGQRRNERRVFRILNRTREKEYTYTTWALLPCIVAVNRENILLLALHRRNKSLLIARM